jgi:hypothetical protein
MTSINFGDLTPEDLEIMAERMRAEAAGVRVKLDPGKPLADQFLPPPSPPQDKYAATAEAWSQDGYDFTTPSGKTCRLRPLPVEEMAASGLLDRLTRLPGITQGLIDKAEGQPPAASSGMKTPDPDQMKALVETMNIVLPLIVVKPEVHPTPPKGEEKVLGQVYVDSIPLSDRIALLNEAVGGVSKFDGFRV